MAITTSWSREATCFHPWLAVNLRLSIKILVHPLPPRHTRLALHKRRVVVLCLPRTSLRLSTRIRVPRLQAARPVHRPLPQAHRLMPPVHRPPPLRPVIHQARLQVPRVRVIAKLEPARVAVHRLHPARCGARVACLQARVPRHPPRARLAMAWAALQRLHPQVTPCQKPNRLQAPLVRLARLQMHRVAQVTQATQVTSRTKSQRARHHP